ncbi:glycosyltransferase family 2 protein [Hymenobacter armeniacus]|uniref:Glycosyltransferase family 2 protein n=1 Tax=Hymenobacter armeniacus TaxID=2771358 RepID=A0ABR8JQF4_9BACT|nr:glycosyltransferase family 2 protein [Hymenobacter armeniacus]MBD2721557.1 glycosyltransferase family 2 protein [Hymenobacter armeniacus]
MMSDPVEKKPPSFSVVIPVYGCAEALPELHRQLTAALGEVANDYQIILVNDNSPDASWALIEELANTDAHLLGLNLSRNFGQHAAITAGLDRATGEWVVVMDCDLQDVPAEIPNLYAHARQHGLDVVFGRRVNRQDAASKQWLGRSFYRLLAWLGGPVSDPTTGNFGIFHQRVVAALRQVREPTRAFPLQVRWLGFRQGTLDVQHAARAHGKSSYRVGQLVRMASTLVLAYSDKPLRLLVKLGTMIVAGALVAAAWLAGRALLGQPGLLLEGLLVSVWLLGGLGLAALGLVGLYVSRVFEGVKNRPLYVVRNEIHAPGNR